MLLCVQQLPNQTYSGLDTFILTFLTHSVCTASFFFQVVIPYYMEDGIHEDPCASILAFGL